MTSISRIAIFNHEADLVYARGARQWAKLAVQVRQRVDSRLSEFAVSGKGDVKKLKVRQGSRLRVGDWRVIFYEEDGSIIIVAVGHRREIYD